MHVTIVFLVLPLFSFKPQATLIMKILSEEKIKNAKVLMVGAGGIGCELLKNLVLTGFQDIKIVSGYFFLLYKLVATFEFSIKIYLIFRLTWTL